MSFKSDFIAKHGEEAYAKRLARRREWGRQLPGGESSVAKIEEMRTRSKHESMIEHHARGTQRKLKRKVER